MIKRKIRAVANICVRFGAGRKLRIILCGRCGGAVRGRSHAICVVLYTIHSASLFEHILSCSFWNILQYCLRIMLFLITYYICLLLLLF